MLPRRRATALACAFAAIALGASGCSDDGVQASPASHSAPPTTTASDRVPTTGEAVGEYGLEARWLCLPERDDPCSIEGLSVAEVNPGGVTVSSLAESGGEAGGSADTTEPPVDCFYVYPTVSLDEGPISDWNASDEEAWAARMQAAPLSRSCRVFAPVYRQYTLEAILGGASGGDVHDPFDDVRDAWRTYLATRNDGRGVVLVGHSQGSMMLSRLIAEEIEPDPDVADLLVAAYLPGMSVQVPPGGVVGGTFASTPLCTTPDDTGCVVTWASYRDEVGPVDASLFGRNEAPNVAACNPPNSLDGSRRITRPLLPAGATATMFQSLLPGIGDEPTSWYGDEAVDADFASLPDFVTIECRSSHLHAWAAVTVHGDPTDARADDIVGDLGAAWGLHLVDVSLVLGDMIDLIGRQASAWIGR